jgi:DNA mismatch repair ATPase MutS
MTDKRIDTADLENILERYRKSITTLIAAAFIIAGASISLSITQAYLFILGLILLIPFLSVAYYLSVKRKKLKYLMQIRNDWGTDRIVKERDFKSIRYLYDFISSDDKNNFYIDEQTWKDLNLDRLYSKIDRTYTDPGEAVLYRMLREPLFDKKVLDDRNRIIGFFQKNQEARERVQLSLVRLGHQFVHNDLFSLLWREQYPDSRIRLLYSAMALATLISLFLPLIFWSWIFLLVPVALFFINLLIHYAAKRNKDMETVSFPYLINCIKAAGAISVIRDEELRPYTSKLGELHKASRRILKKARFLFSPNTAATDPVAGIFLEYLNIFFLFEVRAFYNTRAELSRHTSELRELYLVLGELDTLQSVASYRAGLPAYTEPEFITNKGIYLEVREARQPLLDDPVPVSVSLNKNVVIITGSNMGGKSTFLRTIGTNVLLAQTIATSTASAYYGSFFRIITSISRTDDLVAGKSFYYVEAERILRAIQGLNSEISTLCIIDEMLSGTNSTERLQASEAIIRYLATQNTLAIIATHDLELAERLKGICDFYHFSGSVDENGLKFDYLLKPGIATSRNAIALLKYLGYPGEITG